MKYLLGEIREELNRKYRFVKEHADIDYLSYICKRMEELKIEKNAQVESYHIEHPYEKIPFSVPRNRKNKHIREGIKDIEHAFNWGIANFDPVKFDESFIREVAGRIMPFYYEEDIAKYRTDGVRITGATTIPPDAYKLVTREIPWFVDSLKQQLTCPHIVNKIESAAFAHLHLARIHPFIDGNGRTARTLQDIILYHYGIPAPLIENGERYEYYLLLDQAVSGWKNNRADDIPDQVSDGERLFYTFIAGKVNISLDKVVNKCEDRRNRIYSKKVSGL
jgi:Fic family protein